MLTAAEGPMLCSFSLLPKLADNSTHTTNYYALCHAGIFGTQILHSEPNPQQIYFTAQIFLFLLSSIQCMLNCCSLPERRHSSSWNEGKPAASSLTQWLISVHIFPHFFRQLWQNEGNKEKVMSPICCRSKHRKHRLKLIKAQIWSTVRKWKCLNEGFSCAF